MNDILQKGRLVAAELRQAERSIEAAQRDLLAFMLTTTEANASLGFSPAMAQSIMKPAIAALASLSESQDRLSSEAHPAALRIAKRFRIAETDLGGGDPKPEPQAVPGGGFAYQTTTPAAA